jgi:hypothetical protein
VQQARATLDFLAQATEGAQSPYALMLRSEAEQLRRKQDYYVLHDHLEEFNEALFFHQFAARAARHGLAFLAEAEFRMMQIDGLPAPVAHTLHRMAPEILQREQLTDFLRNRNFRQTLLVHQDAPIDRALTPERVNSLWVASAARAAGDSNDPSSPAPGEFRMPDGSGLRTPHPITKAAMAVLAKQWPAPIPFSDLAAMAATRIGLTGDVDDAQTTTRCVGPADPFAQAPPELHALGPAFADRARCMAASVAGRWLQAAAVAACSAVTKMVGLDDADRRLLSLLDGSLEREAIASQAFPGKPPKNTSDALDDAMARLARQALLVQ